jgi:hypothetical protein
VALLISSTLHSYILNGGEASSQLEQRDLSNSFTLDLELNTKAKTLNFFINNQQLNYRITNISGKSLYFALSAYDTASGTVEIVSVKRSKVSSATNNSNWQDFQWKD